jgi:hypothetical protein
MGSHSQPPDQQPQPPAPYYPPPAVPPSYQQQHPEVYAPPPVYGAQPTYPQPQYGAYPPPGYQSPGYYPPAGAQVQMVGPRQANTAHVVIAWIFAVVTFGYMLPWAIAATRAKSNSVAIALLNLFLGWSLIGWIVAMVMACSTEPQNNVVLINNQIAYQPPPPPGYYSR